PTRVPYTTLFRSPAPSRGSRAGVLHGPQPGGPGRAPDLRLAHAPDAGGPARRALLVRTARGAVLTAPPEQLPGSAAEGMRRALTAERGEPGGLRGHPSRLRPIGPDGTERVTSGCGCAAGETTRAAGETDRARAGGGIGHSHRAFRAPLARYTDTRPGAHTARTDPVLADSGLRPRHPESGFGAHSAGPNPGPTNGTVGSRRAELRPAQVPERAVLAATEAHGLLDGRQSVPVVHGDLDVALGGALEDESPVALLDDDLAVLTGLHRDDVLVGAGHTSDSTGIGGLARNLLSGLAGHLLSSLTGSGLAERRRGALSGPVAEVQQVLLGLAVLAEELDLHLAVLLRLVDGDGFLALAEGDGLLFGVRFGLTVLRQVRRLRGLRRRFDAPFRHATAVRGADAPATGVVAAPADVPTAAIVGTGLVGAGRGGLRRGLLRWGLLRRRI